MGCWSLSFFHHSYCSSALVPTAALPLWIICQISLTHAFKATLHVACRLLPSLFLGTYDILGHVHDTLHLFYLLSYFCLYKIKFKYIPRGFLCTRNACVYFFLPILSHSALCQLSENHNTRKTSQVSKSWPLRLLSTCLHLYIL